MSISNYIPSSRVIQPGVVPNAAARPASPYIGQAILQVDTNQVLYWNGAGWYPAWNTAWGFIAQTTLATSIGYITTVQDILSLTFTAVANRRYRYFVSGLVVNNSSGNANPMLCDASNNNLRECFFNFPGTTNNYQTVFFDYVETASSSGSLTRKIRHQTGSGAGTYYYGADSRDQIAWKIRVEDIGPA